MTPSAVPSYAGYRFPAEVINHAVWLYFRFPLSLRMVEELLAARGIIVSHETVRQWALKFGQAFANQIRRRLPGAGDKWHIDEVVLTISGVKHWLWRAVDQTARPGWCWTSWCRAGATHGPPKACCASC
jgi:putative transposase